MAQPCHRPDGPGYPDELIHQATLPDCRTVTIRPIRPEDAGLEQDFVKGLSAHSRYQRFLYTLRDLSPEMLSRLTQIDYRREMALIALQGTPQGERQVGVARYVTLPDGQSCEFAIVVADDWQGQGLAYQLMQRLIEAARDRGLRVMEGFRLLKNARMQDLARSLGFQSSPDPDDPTLVRMRLLL